jgi:RNA polymerase primary sigma factor
MDQEWQPSLTSDDSEGSPVNGYQFPVNGSGGAYPHRGKDSVREYLQAIGRIRLLTAEEEIELSRQIADLLHLETICAQLEQEGPSENSLTLEEKCAAAAGISIRDYHQRIYWGRRAKEKLVAANLRLVVSIAKRYLNRGVPFLDLIQEGSLGLIRAAEKFDGQRGFKFSTYATWWIRQAINRAVASQANLIRLPSHVYETLSRLKKETKLLSQELGRRPNEEELAQRLEITIEKLHKLLKAKQMPLSLEMKVGAGDSELGDLIDSAEETPYQVLEKESHLESLAHHLREVLTPREAEVIFQRYGLEDGIPKKLKDIGEQIGVSRERARQIEKRALRKLRAFGST